MLQIAHRGSSTLYGDNNMTSFTKAIEQGFDMIELDVQLCKTGEVVIYHDTFIKDDYICNYTLTELKNMNIVTLHDFLKVIQPNKIKLFFDLKGNENVVITLIDVLKKYISNVDFYNIYISSFNRKFVPILMKLGVAVHIGFTSYNMHTLQELKVLTTYCSYVCLHWSALDAESISYLKTLKKLVFSFTCSDDMERRKMLQYELDGIVTNYLLWTTEKIKECD